MSSIKLCDTPNVIDLCIVAGSTFRHSIQVLTGNTEATALPVDYTGATAELQVRDRDTNDLLHSMTTANGGLSLDNDGNIGFYVSPADSTVFTWDRGVYESLEITYANGDVEAFSKGSVAIGRERTK